MNIKQIIGIVLSALILIVMMLIPGGEDLSQAGIRTIGMLIAFLIMLITGPFRLMHTGLFFLGLMPVLGVAPTFGAALSGMGSPIIIFVIGSFGIAAAFTELPLAKRILAFLLRKFGKSIKMIMLALMASAWLISGFVASVPACVVFLAIAVNFLELYDDPEEKKRSGRAFMIAIPVAVMIGSIMTPIAGAINIITLDKLREFTGTTISFVQWMAAGIPLAVVTLPLAWGLILKIHRPVEVSKEMVERFIDSFDIPKKISPPELKALFICGAMMALWIASSWVEGINVMVVALLGVCVMCVPQLRIISFETFVKNIAWDPIFLTAAVLALGNLMVVNGVSDWMISLLPGSELSTPILLAFTAALFFTMLIIIPIAPSLIIILAAPLVALAVSSNTSPALVMLTAAFCANCCFLLPLDTVPILSYSKGYYSIRDIFVSSFPIQIFLVIAISLWLTLIGGVLGLA